MWLFSYIVFTTSFVNNNAEQWKLDTESDFISYSVSKKSLIVSFYIKWVKTSWTCSISRSGKISWQNNLFWSWNLYQMVTQKIRVRIDIDYLICFRVFVFRSRAVTNRKTFLRKDLFSFTSAQHVLSYHLIQGLIHTASRGSS